MAKKTHEHQHHDDHNHDHGHHEEHHDDHASSHEHDTKWVVWLTAITMVAEVFFGYWTNSMALLSDGYHMASHVLALGLTWGAYVACRKYANSKVCSFNRDHLLALSGFTSAFLLLLIALVIFYQSFERFFHPLAIQFSEAIAIAVLWLIVNVLSAAVLHKWHEHHDANIRSAYIHVLADGFTSVTAIIALTLGAWFGWIWLDSITGIIGSMVILQWAISMLWSSGKILVHFENK